MESVNLETRCAWAAHDEYFEYYAFECPDQWLELSKEYFTQEHGADECAKIDWDWIKEQLKGTLHYYLKFEYGDEIPPADPYYRAFYGYDEEETTS